MKVYICDNGCDELIAVQEDHFIDFVSFSIEKDGEESCPFLDDFEEYLGKHMSLTDCFLQKESKEGVYSGYKRWAEQYFGNIWAVTKLL